MGFSVRLLAYLPVHPLFFLLVFLTTIRPAAAQDLSKDAPEFKPLKYRSIGPAAGGRVSRVAGVPGDLLTYYAATASGGVWKSVDGGITWKPIFDDQPIASIGSIAVSPSDPNVVYVGSGEANIRGNVSAGNGIYKSIDGGKTWAQVWKQEGQIGTIIVHPTKPDMAFAAVLGHAFGPNEQRGVYRTTDGGKTWQRVLYKDQDTGASDVCFDPSNPNVLFAGFWQARRRPWELTSGGPGSGLYTSRDGGETWKQLTGNGLPEGIWGKVGVAVAPSDGRRVYALIEAEKGGLFRSDDGGEKWELASDYHGLRQRAWYYTTFTVDPKNPDLVWFPQVRMLKTIDGGKTVKMVKIPHHGDNHDVWIDPKNPQRMIVANDGGVDITTNGGEGWYAPALPISQFYHVAVDNSVPYLITGAMQDISTAAIPSNSLNSGGITQGDWYSVGGGEAGHTASDPKDGSIIYAGEYGGYISRYDHHTRQAHNVSIYPNNPSGHGAEDLRYRFQWTAPILISPHDSNVIYHGANVLFKTTDAGKTWTTISDDLTRNDKSKQKWSGGPLTGDNTGVETYCTIFAVAESPKQKDLIWVGSDDGLVHLTRDGGRTWKNVTANIPGMPEWGTVSLIEPSPFDAGTAYLVVDAHRLDNMRPYLYKTTDFGQTWKSLAEKLPAEVYLHAVREDPKHQGVLYLGTERGVMYSTNDGTNWQPLKLNFPTVAVHDLRVKDDNLVVGTHGRSIWILDDLTPIRDLSPQVKEQDAFLFAPRPAVRWRYHRSNSDRYAGDNPPPGAVIYYYLKQKPKGNLTLDILDSQGKLVNTLTTKKEPPEDELEVDIDDDDDSSKKVLSTEPGVQRVVWDLTYKGAAIIKGAKRDSGDPRVGPMVTPGTYTLKLNGNGKALTSSLVVQPDPRVRLTAADLDEQLQFALSTRDDITKLVRMVNQLRSIKQQLASHNDWLKDNPKAEPLIKSAQAMIAKCDALEEKLHNPKAQVAYDILAQPGGAKLYSMFSPFFEFLKDSDGAPTQGMRDVYRELRHQLEQSEAEMKSLVSNDLVELNHLARKLEIPYVGVTESTTSQSPSGQPN